MEKIAILYDASQAVLSTFDLDEVLVLILNIVRDYFNVTNAAIMLLDKETQEFYPRQHIGRFGEAVVKHVPLGEGIIGNAARMKRPIYVPDVTADSRYISSVASTQSELAIPLMVRDEVVGVLDFQSNELAAFDEETVDLLTMFSTQASIAIENARLYTLVERRAAQVEAINVIARNTTAIVDLHTLLETICPLLLTNFNVRHVAVYLCDDDSLQLAHHSGALTLTMPERTLLTAGMGLVSVALERDEVLLQQDVSTSDDYVPMFSKAAAELCIPLTFAGEKVGVLALLHDHVAGFVEDELDPLSAVAGICAAAIKNCQHFEEAKQLAYRDGLTGIFNRRFFEERIHEELERSDRYSTGLAMLMLDIDRFKSLNDEYGHMLGDEVLRQVSRMLAHQTRKTDLVCRYGGEEFAVLLLQLPRERAVEVADKLRRTIEHAQFPGIARLVTVSIGVATVPENGKTRDQIVAAADAALYSAKQGGRNKVVLAAVKETELSATNT